MEEGTEEIDLIARSAITERIRSRICSIGGVGTGNLVRFRDHLFIVTCRHVADSFLVAENGPYVILRDNQRIRRENLSYIARTNGTLDTAVVEVHDESIETGSYEEEDFRLIEDFSKYPLHESNLFFCGFPSHLSHETERGLGHMWMSYMTLPSEEKQPTENFIYARYEVDNDKNINSEGLRTKLPNAPGLSGAFIFEVASFEGGEEEIWSPDNLKVIAIQMSWNKESWVKGVNVKHALNMIATSVST